jgi:cytoskeletal protein CcmA (bactofilin family)
MSFIRGGDSKDKPTADFSAAPILSNTSSTRKDAFLGKGVKVVGSLSFAGPAEIEGYIEGEIEAQDRLVIGESAVINAKITGTEIVIRGTVTGDITAKNRLYLQKPAKVVGNVKCGSLGIEEGVAFEGRCTMDSKEPPAKPACTAGSKPLQNKTVP